MPALEGQRARTNLRAAGSNGAAWPPVHGASSSLSRGYLSWELCQLSRRQTCRRRTRDANGVGPHLPFMLPTGPGCKRGLHAPDGKCF